MLVKSNVILYRIWFYYNKHRLNDGNKRLPSVNDDYYFDGYPRSGNTYTYNLIKFLFPNLKSTSHFHTVAGLKIAINYKKRSFVIIRNPQDAVISLLFTKKNRNQKPLALNIKKLINELLAEWLNYYSFVYENLPKLTIIEFENAINKPDEVMKIISNKFNRRFEIPDELEFKIKEYNILMKQKENSKEVSYSSLPNNDRDLFKTRNRKLIKTSSLYPLAEGLYKKIID